MSVIKNIRIIFFLVLLVSFSSQSKSEIKVAFIEMNNLINQSAAGKSLIKQLSKIDQNNQKDFKDRKDKLNNEKNDLLKKKNILSKEEYEKKTIDLNTKFKSFQKDVQIEIDLLQSKRNTGMKKILDELNSLLSEYSNKNQLTFIIDQKNIIIGKTDLNITKEILELLNKKITKINVN